MGNIDRAFEARNGLSVDNITGIFSGTLAPDTNNEVAPRGSIYLRLPPSGNGEVWLKYGNVDNEWINLQKQAYLSASSDPTATNDDVDTASLGRNFYEGSIWVNQNTNEAFLCVDSTTSTAIWSSLTSDNLSSITKESTGFTEPENVIVTYDSTTRKVTLTGTVVAYYQGEIVSLLTSGWVSEAHAATNNTWFLYYNGSAFVWTNAPWDFSDLLICFVDYQSSYKFALRESHGLMQWQSHKSNHNNIGTWKSAGGSFSDFILNSTTVTDRRPHISSTTLEDEDLSTVNPSLITDDFTHFYLSGTNTINVVTGNLDIATPGTGSRLQWNEFSGGTWSFTDLGNNKYAKILIMGIPVTADAESQDYRYIFIHPQTQSTSLAEIQALNIGNYNLGGWVDIVTEFNFIGEIIVQGDPNNWTLTEVNELNGNKISQVSSPSIGTVSHDATTNRSLPDQHPASAITFPNDAVNTHIVNMEEALNHVWSAASVDGFSITENGDGTVTVADGTVVLRSTDSHDSPLVSYAVTGGTTGTGITALIDNDQNFVYIDYNAGIPSIEVINDPTTINGRTKTPIHIVTRVGNTTHVVDLTAYTTDYAYRTTKKDFYVYGYEHATGGTVTTETGTRNIAVTAGSFYLGKEITHAAFDTSVADTFTYLSTADSGATWTRTTAQTQIDNTQYNNPTTGLVTLGNNKFGVHWVFIILNSPHLLYVLYGQDEYNNVSDAQNAMLPATLPPEIQPFSTGNLIAQVIIEKNATTFTDIQSPFAGTVLASQLANTHNLLSGLNVGDYQHLTALEKTAFNANTVHRTSSGTDHTYINQDVTTSGNPVFVSVTSKNASPGFANFYATRTSADIQSLDWLGSYGFGAEGADGNDIDAARIRGVASENWTTIAHGTKLEFDVTANGGTSYYTAMILAQDGKLNLVNDLSILKAGEIKLNLEATTDNNVSLNFKTTATTDGQLWQWSARGSGDSSTFDLYHNSKSDGTGTWTEIFEVEGEPGTLGHINLPQGSLGLKSTGNDTWQVHNVAGAYSLTNETNATTIMSIVSETNYTNTNFNAPTDQYIATNYNIDSNPVGAGQIWHSAFFTGIKAENGGIVSDGSSCISFEAKFHNGLVGTYRAVNLALSADTVAGNIVTGKLNLNLRNAAGTEATILTAKSTDITIGVPLNVTGDIIASSIGARTLAVKSTGDNVARLELVNATTTDGQQYSIVNRSSSNNGTLSFFHNSKSDGTGTVTKLMEFEGESGTLGNALIAGILTSDGLRTTRQYAYTISSWTGSGPYTHTLGFATHGLNLNNPQECIIQCKTYDGTDYTIIHPPIVKALANGDIYIEMPVNNALYVFVTG